jgi:hypothetical protein
LAHCVEVAVEPLERVSDSGDGVARTGLQRRVVAHWQGELDAAKASVGFRARKARNITRNKYLKEGEWLVMAHSPEEPAEFLAEFNLERLQLWRPLSSPIPASIVAGACIWKVGRVVAHTRHHLSPKLRLIRR